MSAWDRFFREVAYGGHTRPIPAARRVGLVITDSGDGLLVYDQARHHIHHLDRFAALVFRRLDGRRTLADLLVLAQSELGPGATDESIRMALRQLADADLLADTLPSSLSSSPQALSRRRFLTRAAAGGVVIPSIVSVTAPNAAQANSCGWQGEPCGSPENCCDGLECLKETGLCAVVSTCSGPEDGCVTTADCCEPRACWNGDCVDCAPEGGECRNGYPCCGGLVCESGMCVPPCGYQGYSCEWDGNCCDGLECRGTVCTGCRFEGEMCRDADPCCGDLVCDGGVCIALPPCSGYLESCDTNACCDGLECVRSSDDWICDVLCNGEGEGCTGSEECCGTLACWNGGCADCVPESGECRNGEPCCGGLTCVSDVCTAA